MTHYRVSGGCGDVFWHFLLQLLRHHPKDSAAQFDLNPWRGHHVFSFSNWLKNNGGRFNSNWETKSFGLAVQRQPLSFPRCFLFVGFFYTWEHGHRRVPFYCLWVELFPSVRRQEEYVQLHVNYAPRLFLITDPFNGLLMKCCNITD